MLAQEARRQSLDALSVGGSNIKDCSFLMTAWAYEQLSVFKSPRTTFEHMCDRLGTGMHHSILNMTTCTLHMDSMHPEHDNLHTAH
jgi:hypothetical protein